MWQSPTASFFLDAALIFLPEWLTADLINCWALTGRDARRPTEPLLLHAAEDSDSDGDL